MEAKKAKLSKDRKTFAQACVSFVILNVKKRRCVGLVFITLNQREYASKYKRSLKAVHRDMCIFCVFNF